jgi:cell division protein FtsQ
MSDPRGHDHDPDRAALAELQRAFARPTPAPKPAPGGGHDPASVEIGIPDRGEDDHRHDDVDIDADDEINDEINDEISGEISGEINDDISGEIDAILDPDPALDPTVPAPTSSAPTESVPDRVVIEIVDEDLPDPVYVAGNLERDSSRPIVFIEDDDSRDTVDPSSDRNARRGIEPRMRERRVAVRRAASRKRLKWVFLIGSIIVVGVGALAILGSPLFAIRAEQVTVTGNVYTDHDHLQAVIDDLVGTPVLVADTQAAERALEAIPWVDEARVQTKFPHAVSIEIREREAMATYQGPDARFRVLDREGRVLDVLDKYPFAYLLLGGPDPVDLEPGQFAPSGYAAAAELAKNLTGSVRGKVEMVEVTADGSRLVMRLNDGSEVRFGEARDLFAKLVRLETVLASPDPRPPGVIDVSTKDVTLPGTVPP